ncbi:Glutamate--tRNA ligase 1 [Polystyrenella longa]|uniref:Glutamate--tRNA ligase n=1 Tax=Polystyrenella longa TaxID=2528007 RepID=A0A518CGT4_9PLAN|nr:glutamate--tRNA ligase [Polystyrenella longa]QDU78433.1 Glutamate--tRNA ligase 1 [Polystyrenella longa]
MTTVRTRFAPSPTGYMHIGGMRTALFNWLWARHNNGVFILRVDDTDRERNVEEALGPILQAFKWLGLDWDEGPEVGGPHGPYFQSERDDLYKAGVEKLLAEGKAYHDYDTPEQIKADREEAQKEKKQYINIRRSLELTEETRKQYEDEGRPSVVRFLIPRDQKVEINDEVRGHVEWDAGLISDPVIQRTDGSCLYNFATVVDDASMNITHVIRAEEHLSNTPTQVLLHQALGNTLPTFAHIPFVTAPGTTKKLSKRDLSKYKNNPNFKKMFDRADQVFPLIGLGDSETLNPVMVEYYERIGYLPAAVLNSLSRTGWSLDDKTEILSLDTVVKNFTLDRVVKNPAGLDPDKLFSFQGHWMGELSLDEKIDGCLPYLLKAGILNEAEAVSKRAFVGQVVESLGDRLKLFADILDVAYFFQDEIEYSEKDFKKRVAKEGVPELLTTYRERVAALDEFNAEQLEALLKGLCEEKEVSGGLLIHGLRISTTGSPVGPGLYDCLLLVGKENVLKRIDTAVARANSM